MTSLQCQMAAKCYMASSNKINSENTNAAIATTYPTSRVSMGEKNLITVVSKTTEIQSLRSQFVCFVKLTAEITRNYFQQKMTGF